MVSSTSDESNPVELSEECGTPQSAISNNSLPVNPTHVPVEESKEWIEITKCLNITEDDLYNFLPMNATESNAVELSEEYDTLQIIPYL